jgi:hypothetical protein
VGLGFFRFFSPRFLPRTTAITGDEVNLEIQVDTMASDKVFWKILEENLEKIEEFYKKQLQQFTEQFHVLTLQVRFWIHII